MTNKEKIREILKDTGETTAREVSESLKISRVLAHRLLKELIQEGLAIPVGKTTQAKYVLASDKETVKAALKSIDHIHLRLKNFGLDESAVLKRIEEETGILIDVKENVQGIVRIAFTEMLNNAIDHSRSPDIEIDFRRSETAIIFEVRDFGIGIFQNVKNKLRLPGTMDAIQEILKGKTTTAPKEHTGQGIFFTSKMADVFIIDSHEKRLTVNNLLPDIFIADRKSLKGTRVSFSISLDSPRTAKEVYDRYTSPIDEGAEFNKTRVTVKLYRYGQDLPSRSEAKRVTTNLENFQEVELDFTDVETIGQGFADEVFRVWNNRYPDTEVFATNANENVAFMIKRAGGQIRQDQLNI